jgi:RNA polymerase sigma-70 factor (ECF subfamily)
MDMPGQEEFIEQAAPFRAELIAHCYRMLGSVHDAEDLVQETYLRGWRGYPAFEKRSALRTWLYRIATTACLRAMENRARRVLPADLEDHVNRADDHEWLEPIPDSYVTLEDTVEIRQSVRLAVMTAMQELPARQRAVLILRDVVQFSAAEVAELLETTPAAINSSLQRARARLAEIAPDEGDVTEPTDTQLSELLDRYCAAFENADMTALTGLLQDDIKLEMPPMPEWFTGRDAVLDFLAKRAFAKPVDLVMVRTSANGQPAVAEYRRSADSIMEAHSIQVLTCRARNGKPGIAVMTVFLDSTLFAAFGLPPIW